MPFAGPTSATAKAMSRRYSGNSSPMRCSTSPQNPCRPLDRRARGVHQDQYRGHIHAVARGARALARLPAERARRFRFHHVSTDEVFGSLGLDGRIHRNDPLSSELALFGIESGFRPPGARLASHLRLADRDQQLLEQLRSLSIPGKADPARDHQGAQRRGRCRSTATGDNVRDWLYVEDHARALFAMLARARSARATMSAGMPSAPT